jgi:site-specific DNA-adenine methylase
LNDNDTNLISFLKDVKKDNFKSYIDYYNTEIKKYIIDGKCDPSWHALRKLKEPTLHQWFIMAKGSRGKNMISLRLTNIKYDDYEYCINFFKDKKVKLTCEDYLNTFDKVKNDKKCFVFIDPPYLDSCNTNYKCFHGGSVDNKNIIIDRTKMFIDILDFIKNAKCKVMLIINKNSITEYIYKGYIKGEYDKYYDITGRRTKHLIITNY